MRVPGTRQKCHHPRHDKILDGYYNFNTYVVLGSLSTTTNFGRTYVQYHVMTSEASRVVSIIYHNNKEYDSIINPLCTISTNILQKSVVTNRTTTVSNNLNPLCTQISESIVSMVGVFIFPQRICPHAHHYIGRNGTHFHQDIKCQYQLRKSL